MELIRANYDSESSSSSDLNFEDESDSISELTIEEENRLPEVPSDILNKYYIQPNVQKYEENQAMTKTFHLGKWSSFIHIDWRPTSIDRQKLGRFIAACNNTLASRQNNSIIFEPSYYSTLKSPRPLHISLTYNVYFDQEQERESFYNNLAARIHEAKLPPFKMEFESIPSILTSTKKDSLFLALPVKEQIRNSHIKTLDSIIQQSLNQCRKVYANTTTHSSMLQLTNDNNSRIFEPVAHMSIGFSKITNSNSAKLHNSENSHQLVTNAMLQISNLSLADPPSFIVNSIRVDKNRQSLTIRFW